jgi:hypothetical protein
MLPTSIGTDEHLDPLIDEVPVDRLLNVFDPLIDEVQIDVDLLRDGLAAELDHYVRT